MVTKKLVIYVLFFIALTAGFLAFLSAKGMMDKKKIVVSEVQPFLFTNQDGEAVNQSAIKGKVTAVNFFFTTCRGICPKMNGNLLPVYQKFKSHPDFQILSHTSDPDRDDPATLKRYADSLKVDTKKWVFLTGKKDSLYNAARFSYKIDDPANYAAGTENVFMHTQFIALVNRSGEVIRIYDGIKPSEVKQMAVEIEKLLKEDGNKS